MIIHSSPNRVLIQSIDESLSIVVEKLTTDEVQVISHSDARSSLLPSNGTVIATFEDFNEAVNEAFRIAHRSPSPE